MSKSLKGVIFSISNVLAPKDTDMYTIYPEVERLLKFILDRGLQPVVFANRPKRCGSESLEDVLSNRIGRFPWFIAFRDRLPPKQRGMEYILSQMGWDATEAIYIGSKHDDMLAALHGGVLFLNAMWYETETDYGIKFESPRDVARFIDIFCLRKSLWHYSICDQGFEYYSLAPFSTYKPEFAIYSQDAKDSAKFGAGHPDFWTKYLWSTIYFSELYKKIDFVTPYPGHKSVNISIASNILEEPMLAFTKCFRMEYLRDLIIRHTTSRKSQSARTSGEVVDHCNQLNTIHLNPTPLKGSGKRRYSSNPLEGKTVLVVDDFCTEGYSLEAARIYMRMAGANVICLSWLKTINTNYKRIRNLEPVKFNPFEPNEFSFIRQCKEYSYRDYILDAYAPEEIDSRLAAYDNWCW